MTRVLLSTLGSRGDVQPLAALARALRDRGAEVRLCVPPDLLPLVRIPGVRARPIGSPVRRAARAVVVPGSATELTAAQQQLLADGAVSMQVETLGREARDVDVVVCWGPLMVAGPSVAAARGAAYVPVHFCPVTLRDWADGGPEAVGWDPEVWRRPLDTHRTALGLPPVDDVRRHLLTDRPWLAADPALAPWSGSPDLDVVQTGAWLVQESAALPYEVEAFLDAGEPPVYVGLGSMPAPAERWGQTLVDAVRRAGRRTILAGGWAGLTADDGPDVITVDEIDHSVLFPRVAAVVHHGGAGTTTAAALAGRPQVVLPQQYDQPWWAERVEALGVGAAVADVGELAEQLDRHLAPDIVARAEALATEIRTDGAETAAALLAG